MSLTICRSSVVAAALFLAIGCEKKDETPAAGTATPKAPTTQQVQSAVSDAAGKAQDAAAKMTADAKAQLDQAVQYIKENKFDLAEKTIAQLEKMKASLPESIQNQIDNARKMLDAAKAGASKLPGM